METVSHYLPTFLINSVWQIALAAAVAAVVCLALRKAPAVHRHTVWVAALAIAILLPLAGTRGHAPSASLSFDPSIVTNDPARADSLHSGSPSQAASSSTVPAPAAPRGISFTQTTARILAGVYLLFLLFRFAVLALSLMRTRVLQQNTQETGVPDPIECVRERCQRAFGLTDTRLVFSERVSAPASAGRAILLPEALCRETSEDVLTTAIGHEMAHMARHDFGWNLLFEILSLPLSFHPAMWLIRREIARTREMACDELVAGNLIGAAPYARSIVQIAAEAVSTSSPAYLLGALDGGNLEERIRSLTEPRTTIKRPRLLLGAGLAALVVCAMLASTVALTARAQDAPSDLMNSAAAAYKRGDYQDAVTQLRTAVRQDPANVSAKVALAHALLRPFSPSQIPDTVIIEARQQFTDALAIDPTNNAANDGMLFLFIAARQFSQAHDFALQAIKNNASDKSLYYMLGFLDWSMTYPDYAAARKTAGMQPADPGNIPDAGLRQTLQEKHGAQVEEGFRMLQIALQLDPDYSDAMAYMNLLDRIAAGYSDTPAQAADYIAKANDWVAKALAAKRKAALNPPSKAPDTDDLTDLTVGSYAAPPPPPPPPPPHQGNVAATVDTPLVVGSQVQAAKLISQVNPVYPSEARAAGIQGQVLLTVVIGKDGAVESMEAKQGDHALVQAAFDAVRQWKYQPTLLNGQPVKVATQVNVNFSLNQ